MCGLTLDDINAKVGIAKFCQENNIKIVDKKPVWAENCTHCMACIGNCPVEAIGYGKMTDIKTPYNIGKYKSITDNLSDSRVTS